MSRLRSAMHVLGELVAGVLGGPGWVDSPAFAGGEGIKAAWLSWQDMTYADTPTSGTGSSVDLSALDRQVAAIFDEYFRAGELDPAALEQLERCDATLTRVVPSLSGDARSYFAMASSIARWMLEDSGVLVSHTATPAAPVGRPVRLIIAGAILLLGGGLFALSLVQVMIEGAESLFIGLANAVTGVFGVVQFASGVGVIIGRRRARLVGIACSAITIILILWAGLVYEQAILAWPFYLPPYLYVVWALWTASGEGKLPVPQIPGRVWRRVFGIPWITAGLLLVVATIQSPPTWFGPATAWSTVTIAVVAALTALLPALGFAVVRGRVGLFSIASFGILIAFVLFLAMLEIQPFGLVAALFDAALFAGVAASFAAIVALLVMSHETPLTVR